MKKTIPLHSLVIGVGPSAHNRTSLINEHFPDYEILSIDEIAQELYGPSTHNSLCASDDIIYAELFHRASLKLRLGERVVVNAPNLLRADRAMLAGLGSEYGVPVFYLATDPSGADETSLRRFQSSERDIMRGDGLAEIIDWRVHAPAPVCKQKPSLKSLRENWQGITVVADVHGMLQSVLSAINWAQSRNHYLIFLGDVIDYGANTLEVADEVYRVTMRGAGELILGNHERKIYNWLKQNGKPARISDGNRVTTNALLALGDKRRNQWIGRFSGLVAHSTYWREIGNIVLTHGGIIPSFWTGDVGQQEVEKFCMFGEVSGFTDDHKPTRTYSWVDRIPAATTVIVGHDIRSTQYPLQVKNNSGGAAIFLDTGCGKGGHLSTVDLKFTDGGPRVTNFNVH